MLKGFFYRRASEGSASGTDVSIRFEINSKESILAKTTNLSWEGMQFLLPRGKVILVPDERIMLILNHPEHGEFKIQSEVYYFCNTTDQENNLVVCYGVKFIELSSATWDMIQDYCGTNFPEVTFAPRTQPAEVKVPPLPAVDKVPVRPTRPVDKPASPPEEPVFTPIAPVKIPLPPIPGIIAEPTPAPVSSVETPVTARPEMNLAGQPANQPSVTEKPVPVIPTEIPQIDVTDTSMVDAPTPAVKPQEDPKSAPATHVKIPAATSKKKPAVENRDTTAAVTPVPKEQPETPVQNSIQALAASLAAPPVSSAPAKAQSLSQEMIDRLIEKLQTESQAEANQTPAQIYESLPKPPQPAVPALDQLLVTEHELSSAKSAFTQDQPKTTDTPVGIEYLKSVESINPNTPEKGPYESFLITENPFGQTPVAEQDKTDPFTKLPQDDQPAKPDLTLSSPAVSPAASLLENIHNTEKTTATPPVMAGTSLVDLIMDMDATIQKAGAPLPGTQKEQPELSHVDLEKTKPEPKKNPIPTISLEELSQLSPQSESLSKPEPVHKEKTVAKPAEGFPVIPPINQGASGISMDQKAIDKLVQTLIQEQSLSETASVAESIKPADSNGHNLNMVAETKVPEPKMDPLLQSTILGGQKIPEKPAAVSHPAETKPAPTPWSTHPQPGNSLGANILIPDPNNTRVMDQKSIDIIVQTLTQENNQSSPAPAPAATNQLPPANAGFNQTPVKPFIPVESKRTLDQKAIDQVVQALTQNHAAKSSLNPEAAATGAKASTKEFGVLPPNLASELITNKEKKPGLSLAALSATLHLENGTTLQCAVEQVYVGGLMVHVAQELPLNSVLKISIVGEGTRIQDIQGTCTNCEPGRSGKSGFLAEIFFKNLSNSHMEQFRSLISKLG